MARIDSFLAQLMAYEAEALLVESGDNLYHVKGEQRLPLMQVRAGAIQNAHVVALLGEIAPPAMRPQIEQGAACAWDYRWGTCVFRVELGDAGGRLRARLHEVPAFGAALAPGEPAPALVAQAAEPVGDDDALDDRPAIERLLRAALDLGCTDVHLTAGRRPMVRMDGEMTALPGFGALEAYGLQKMLEEIVPDRAKGQLELNDVDFAYEMDCARVRCNVFRDRTGLGGVFRAFPLVARPASELGLPDALLQMCMQRQGLVVVTGPSGSGKSTTLAAMVDFINEQRADHVITIEDPVEIVHEPKRALINQRQVGEHTGSAARALRAAEREDPDVVMIAEVRDRETLAIALEMAETHLVLCAMRTTSPAAAIERMLDRFPQEQQQHARHALAEVLLGVVAQSLCKRGEGGRVAAFDLLESGPATAALIRDGRVGELPRAGAGHAFPTPRAVA